MLLTQKEKEYILDIFPNIKLSYENQIYKKVLNYDYVAAIPQGTKCYAWFTYHKNKPTCFIIELNKKKITDVKMFNACFSIELSKGKNGTLVYGTLFYTSGNRFFTIEDIFIYKNTNVSLSWVKKIQLLGEILKNEIKQISYKNSYVVFGLPILSTKIENVEKKIQNFKYPIGSLHFYFFNNVNKYLSTKMNPMNQTNETKNIKNTNGRTFIIRPDIQNDIYYLYSLDEPSREQEQKQEQEKECEIAHIPDFKTSVMMNQLFRNIKENENLDRLEESDDEEEFENNQENKFVNLDVSHKMFCQYNHKFKRWVPLYVIK
jgi:hypothetical protein